MRTPHRILFAACVIFSPQAGVLSAAGDFLATQLTFAFTLCCSSHSRAAPVAPPAKKEALGIKRARDSASHTMNKMARPSGVHVPSKVVKASQASQSSQSTAAMWEEALANLPSEPVRRFS